MPVPLGAIAVAFAGAMVATTFAAGSAPAVAEIGGGLSASARDAAWFLTLYDVGQVVGLPLVFILGRGIGRGRAMTVAGLGFALSSAGVAMAPHLAAALAARSVQGVFGGMLPVFMMLMVMSSLRPGQGQAEGMAAFALSSTGGMGFAVALAAGLIHLGDWRTLFWAQAIFGLVYALGASLSLPHEKGQREILRTTDWPTYALLAVSLGCLVVALSEGERHFWFEAWWVTALLLAGGIGLVFGIQNLRKAEVPFIRLSLLARDTFTWSLIIALLYRGATLLAVWVAPQYLVRIQGYSITEVGQTLLIMGPVTLIAVPCAYLLTRFHPRLCLCAGLGLFALAAWLCTGLSPDWAANQLQCAAAAAGAGQAFVMVPVLRYAVDGVQAIEGMTCGLLFNLARILGQVCATACFAQLLTEREKLHWLRMSETVTTSGPALSDRLADLARPIGQWIADPAAAPGAALAGLARHASAQSYTLAYADAFWVLTFLSVAAGVLVWVLPALSSPMPRPLPPRFGRAVERA